MTSAHMTQKQIFLVMTELLQQLFGISPEKIVAEAELVKDLDLDSIDFIDLLSVTSEKYDLNLSPHDFPDIVNLQDFIERFEIILTKQTRK